MVILGIGLIGMKSNTGTKNSIFHLAECSITHLK